MTTETARRPLRIAHVVALAAIAIVAIVVRAVQASAGTVTVVRAGAEAGMVCAALGLAIAVAVVVAGMATDAPRRAGRGAWALIGLVVFATGAGVFVPLWRIAHPPRVLATEVLGGARREASIRGPARGGVYRLEVSATSPTQVGGTYVLHVRRDDPADRIAGALGPTSSLFDVSLAGHQRVDLFLERSDGSVTVTLREPPPAVLGVRVAGAVALLLAIATDLVAVPFRRRGLLTLVVGASALFAFLLGRRGDPGGGEVVGVAAISLFGAAVLVVAAIGGLSAARGRHATPGRRRRSR